MAEKKTIAVMTSYYINNYGSVLQALATKDFFSSLGFRVIFINYIRENVRNRTVVNEKWNSNIVRRIIYKIYKAVDKRSKDKVFKKFVNDNLNLSRPYENKEALYKVPLDADIFCVGSDQMWNSEYNGDVIGENYLDFAPLGSTKISLATSMGMASYSDKELKQMKLLLKDYLFISVREKEAVDILSAAGVKNVHQMLDPTLLLSGDRWRSLCSKYSENGDYVLIYQLNDNPDMQEFAKRLAAKEKIEVKQITYYMSQHWAGIKSIYDPKIEQFISLIEGAKYVITDSFHGTAFSINLNKEFFAFMSAKYAGRITSILSLTGLDDRLVEDIDQYVYSGKTDYAHVNEVLDKCRSEARALVMDAIK